MKEDYLSDALNEISALYIEEAANHRRKKLPVRYIGIAACLLLIASTALQLFKDGRFVKSLSMASEDTCAEMSETSADKFTEDPEYAGIYAVETQIPSPGEAADAVLWTASVKSAETGVPDGAEIKIRLWHFRTVAEEDPAPRFEAAEAYAEELRALAPLTDEDHPLFLVVRSGLTYAVIGNTAYLLSTYQDGLVPDFLPALALEGLKIESVSVPCK